MRFKKSKIYVSVLPVLAIGGSIGFLGTVLGIGGGFMLVPALIYLLRVPTAVVIGHLALPDSGHHGGGYHPACHDQPFG